MQADESIFITIPYIASGCKSLEHVRKGQGKTNKLQYE